MDSAVVVLTSLIPAECATVPDGSNSIANIVEKDELATSNLIYSLAQIPELSPLQTTVKMTKLVVACCLSEQAIELTATKI